MLTINFSEISNKEGIFVTGLAEFMVDSLNTLVKGLPDQVLANGGTIAVDRVSRCRTFHRKVIMIIRLGMMLDEGGCDDHILGFNLQGCLNKQEM